MRKFPISFATRRAPSTLSLSPPGSTYSNVKCSQKSYKKPSKNVKIVADHNSAGVTLVHFPQQLLVRSLPARSRPAA